MRGIEPPVDPPEPKLMPCDQCEGEGEIALYENGETIYEGECGNCEGTGKIDFDPDANPYAPDNWKEYEGIA